MSTRVFYKRDGNISSIRTTTGTKNHKVSNSYYMGSTRGGVTFKNNGVSSRFNNKGQSMGTSMRVGHTTSYYNTFGSLTSGMKSF